MDTALDRSFVASIPVSVQLPEHRVAAGEMLGILGRRERPAGTLLIIAERGAGLVVARNHRTVSRQQ